MTKKIILSPHFVFNTRFMVLPTNRTYCHAIRSHYISGSQNMVREAWRGVPRNCFCVPTVSYNGKYLHLDFIISKNLFTLNNGITQCF
jgi:hypothetical protein